MTFSFQIMTYGCKVNQYESQSIRESWLARGGKEVFEEGASSDIVLLAGCAVTAQGVSDARQMVRKLLREKPKTKVIVTGCAASAEPQDFAFENVVACIAQTAKWNLLHCHPLDLIDKMQNQEKASNIPLFFDTKEKEYPDFSIQNFERSRPVLKIQDGCSHRCSYCIVPLTRGPARSRPLEKSLAEFSRLINAGFREIVISGINLRQYSSQKENFWSFLRSLQKYYKEKHNLNLSDTKSAVRIRLSSLEPSQINQEGLETLAQLAENDFLCPHLHLSLQSGSESVLHRMGREHYSLAKMGELIHKIKDFWDTFALGADFLMGFPQETEKELQETLALVDALPFTYAHVFPYSSRPNTKAASMNGHLEKKVKQEHARQVREIIERKKKVFLEKMLVKKEMFLSLDIPHISLENDNEPITLVGWNEFYVSCVLEGVSYSQNILSHELLKVKPLKIDGDKLITKNL